MEKRDLFVYLDSKLLGAFENVTIIRDDGKRLEFDSDDGRFFYVKDNEGIYRSDDNDLIFDEYTLHGRRTTKRHFGNNRGNFNSVYGEGDDVSFDDAYEESFNETERKPFMETNEDENGNILVEDKQVKFGGATFPKFGWCVILVGGPGSGKSTAVERSIPIDAKHFDKDAIKKLFIAQKQKSDLKGDTISIPDKEGNWKTIDLDDATIDMDGKTVKVGEPYDLTNPRYVTFLHKSLKNVSNKLLAQITGNTSAEKDRLPNVIFDICGSEIGDVAEISNPMHNLGYKVSIVWVMTSPKVAVDRNNHRDRKMATNIVIQKHNDVLNTMNQILANADGILNDVDEFWVVNSEISVGKYERPNNCFKIETKDELRNIIDTTTSIANKKDMSKTDLLKFIQDGQTEVADLLSKEG